MTEIILCKQPIKSDLLEEQCGVNGNTVVGFSNSKPNTLAPYTPQVKAQLIEQFVIDIISEGKTSGKQLSENIKVRCQLNLSPRSISYHFQKMGLNSIKSTFPICLAELKKNY